jgi:hypothetical protein
METTRRVTAVALAVSIHAAHGQVISENVSSKQIKFYERSEAVTATE